MRADILTLKDIFQKDVRYLIPTFQRPYVWNQEEQWEPLWDDVRNTAERYLDTLEDVGEDLAAAQSTSSPHFLGAIVVQHQHTGAAEIEIRHVIDGQQRLTTLQLMLDAAQEVFEHLSVASAARRLSKLVLNDEDFVGSDPDHVFKIWPTNVDRSAFRQAMRNELPSEEYEESAIVQAHEFFKLQIREWVKETAGERDQRAHALEATLIALLQIVVIDLVQKEDSHVIFETLNARGTPLLASDLIKNFVLHQARELGHDADVLYAKHWRGFDEPWWRKEIRQGRIVRPRVDVFLNYWLMMRSKDEVPVNDVFSMFRQYVDKSPASIEEIAEDIEGIGRIYQRLEEFSDDSDLGVFLYRWRVMQAGVITPVLLWLLSQTEAELPKARLHRSLLAIESYFIRRMVGRMTTKNYNTLSLDLLRRLERDGAALADQTVVGFLVEQTADSGLWPDDRLLDEHFRTLPIYRLLSRGRLRLVLEGIEGALRSAKAEEQNAPKALSIEHVMPQSWREHWPLTLDSDEATAEVEESRDRIVHSFGNLTLVNKRLNPALSNSAWPKKRAALGEHSVLFLNKALLECAGDLWTEDTIRERGKVLARAAATVWPAGDKI